MAKQKYKKGFPGCSKEAKQVELYVWDERKPARPSFLSAARGGSARGGVCTPELDVLALPRQPVTPPPAPPPTPFPTPAPTPATPRPTPAPTPRPTSPLPTTQPTPEPTTPAP